MFDIVAVETQFQLIHFLCQKNVPTQAFEPFKLDQVYCHIYYCFTKYGSDFRSQKFNHISPQETKYRSILKDCFRCMFLYTPTCLKGYLLKAKNENLQAEKVREFTIKLFKLARFGFTMIDGTDKHREFVVNSLQHITEHAQEFLTKCGVWDDFTALMKEMNDA